MMLNLWRIVVLSHTWLNSLHMTLEDQHSSFYHTNICMEDKWERYCNPHIQQVLQFYDKISKSMFLRISSWYIFIQDGRNVNKENIMLSHTMLCVRILKFYSQELFSMLKPKNQCKSVVAFQELTIGRMYRSSQNILQWKIWISYVDGYRKKNNLPKMISW